MADPGKRLPLNASGEFFVDSTCIDCDACRQLAPATFADAGEHSYVIQQPETAEQRRAAFRALVACPTASIGAASPAETRAAADEFPLQLEDEVSYCGFNSEKSFGGNSYFVRHPNGNWLARRRTGARGLRTHRAGARLHRYPYAGAHSRTLRSALPQPFSVHRRPPLVEPPPRAPERLAQRVLALLVRADRLYGHARRVHL
jgi:ferredoxin